MQFYRSYQRVLCVNARWPRIWRQATLSFLKNKSEFLSAAMTSPSSSSLRHRWQLPLNRTPANPSTIHSLLTHFSPRCRRCRRLGRQQQVGRDFVCPIGASLCSLHALLKGAAGKVLTGARGNSPENFTCDVPFTDGIIGNGSRVSRNNINYIIVL